MRSTLIFWLSCFAAQSLAQRPSNASLCDWYAIQKYGTNSSASQFNLVQSILALAFAGGSGLTNVSSSLTGIFNPGTYLESSGTNISVDLGSWFNGSIDSTNVNGQAAAVNWLNGGGKVPLQQYLTGDTSSIVIVNTTNEYQLFNHWLAAFSHIFGCTIPAPVPPSTGPTLNLAYVHKFMDLNQTDIGYFIHQLALSASHWGFSQGDSDQLEAQLNAKYNVRCSPPVGTQLFSLCQDPTCPLATSPDCDAYLDANLGPSGVISSATATATAQFTPSSVSSLTPTSSTAPPVSTTTAPSSTPTPAPSSTSLSSGAIAGIAIGGAALTFAFVLALVFLLRRNKRNQDGNISGSQIGTSTGIPSFVPSPRTDPHSSYISNQRVQEWNGPPIQPIAEMESVGMPSPKIDRGMSVSPQGPHGRFGL